VADDYSTLHCLFGRFGEEPTFRRSAAIAEIPLTETRCRMAMVRPTIIEISDGMQISGAVLPLNLLLRRYGKG